MNSSDQLTANSMVSGADDFHRVEAHTNQWFFSETGDELGMNTWCYLVPDRAFHQSRSSKRTWSILPFGHFGNCTIKAGELPD
jgi:hypothetical protein